MKNYEAEKLKKIIAQKEAAMMRQIEETDRLRNENLSLKAELTQCYRSGYNKAIDDAAKLCGADERDEILKLKK